MFTRIILALALSAVLATPAAAVDPASSDAAINQAQIAAITQAQTAMFQAEARYFMLVAQRLQSEAEAAAAKTTAKDRWWAEYDRAVAQREHPPEAPQ